MEAKIPWTLLYDATVGITNRVTPGQLVGFSIFGNDGDDPSAPAQEKALSLTERPGPANNPSSWDTVQMDAPVAQVAPKFSRIAKAADGSIVLEWTGGGTLQAATAVNGPWQDVTGATSPYTLKPTGTSMFGRIKQ